MEKADGRERGDGPVSRYKDDVPVTFRHRSRKKGWLNNWIRVSLVFAALAGGLIVLVGLGQGIEFAEYWILVMAGYGVLVLLLLWEALAYRFSGRSD